MTAPRLIFVVDHFALAVAGTENQLVKMIPGLARDFAVELICLRREGDWLERRAREWNCRVLFFEIRNFKSPDAYLNWWRLVKHLRAAAPDVVHTFFPVSNIIGTLAARLARVPNIVASRRDFGEWMNARYLTATKLANRCVDRIVTNSTLVKNLTNEVEHFPAEKIEVILNGIDLAQMTKPEPQLELKSSLGIPADDDVVVLVANYRPMKRQITLVEAASGVLKRRQNVSFLYVGKDYTPGKPLQTAVQRRSVDLGIANKVFYAHADGDVARYLSFADIGVNCSHGEGISNAIMEYMACGVPCVAAASGGNPDLVAHGTTGLLFECERPEQLADAIVQLLEKPSHGRELAERARNMLSSRMSIDGMIDHFSRFYMGLIGSRASPTPANEL